MENNSAKTLPRLPPSITSLNASHNRFNSDALNPLMQLHMLRDLDLRFNMVEKFPSELLRCVALCLSTCALC